MELDVAERKAVELLRSRLEYGSITTLEAKLVEGPVEQVVVNGTFQDKEGNQRKFQVLFEVRRGQTQVASWHVTK